MLNKSKLTNKKGIGLIEVIAALGLSVIVLTSLVSLSLFTVRSSLQSKLMLEGTKIAERELELLRAYRDSSDLWYSSTCEVSQRCFLNKMINCNTQCYVDYNAFSINPGSNVIGSGAESLTRYFTATKVDGNQLTASDEIVRITVVVSWQVGTQTKYARLYTDLTNWSHEN